MSTGADALKARLSEGAVTLAQCWRVTRKDGARFGFTDHDRDLSFEGTVFETGAGMDAGAIERSTGLSVDNATALGALTSDRVSEADIQAGRFDGAEVRQWLVDWSDTEARKEVFRGEIGEIRIVDGTFEAELRGQAERLNQPVGRTYLRTCDRDLGDARCGVDMTDPAYVAESTVTGVEGRLALTWNETGGYDKGWFNGGALHWLSGANAGLVALVRADSGSAGARKATLWSEARAEIAVGDRFRIVAGCDKHAQTCQEKFANLINFRGFPDIPGEDWVTAYPRSGEVYDGAPRRWEELRFD